MESYQKKQQQRHSIRLKNYDYSQEGAYFITICTQGHRFMFGEINDGVMVLNDAGRMVNKWYHELENKYPNIQCDKYIVMPNHFHCIIEITDNNVIPTDAHVGTSLRGRPYGMDNKKYNASIFDIMDWFKTMTTNEYIRGVKNKNWPRFDKRLWQLRYWDHIVKNENELIRIQEYIENNPMKWENDKLNGGSGNMVMEQHAEYGAKNEPWMV